MGWGIGPFKKPPVNNWREISGSGRIWAQNYKARRGLFKSPCITKYDYTDFERILKHIWTIKIVWSKNLRKIL